MFLFAHSFKAYLALFFGILLCINGLYLLSLDKLHFGVLLPLLLGSGFVVYALFFKKIQDLLKSSSVLRKIWQVLWAIFWLWLISLVCFFIFLFLNNTKAVPSAPAAAIIVLGSGIEDNRPSPTLALRLDRAAIYAKQHPQTPIVVTGGLGFKQTYTEAEVMSDYLTTKHQLKNPIWQESKSTSTAENLKFSAQILKEHGISNTQSNIAIVTSDFHLPRALAIAQQQQYQHSFGLGANTPLYIRYNSWLREYFAYLSGFILNEY